MKPILKKLLCLGTALMLCCPATTHGIPATAAEIQYGLTLTDGVMTLNGKPFYGIGVNYYDPFLVNLRSDVEQIERVEKEFRQLHEAGIPVARISMCGYNANEFSEYLDYPEFYFECLDKTVAYAEKYQIGIIFDLAWWIDAIPDYALGFRSSVGDAASETLAYAREYVSTVVKRYMNSPAVWAWEIGNEYNLDADLSGVLTVSEGKKVSSADIEVYYRELATVIRSIDPYRLITGGDSEPRNAAWHLYHYNNWTADTPEQTAEMMRMLSPDPMNMMSTHVYQWVDNSKENAGNLTMDMIDDFDTRVSTYMAAAKKYGQALFVGEFGIMERSCASQSVAKAILKAQYNAFVKYGVQCACIWVYAKDSDDPMDILPDNNLAYQWNLVVNANENYRNNGQLDTAGYWNNAVPLIYKPETVVGVSDAASAPQTSSETVGTSSGDKAESEAESETESSKTTSEKKKKPSNKKTDADDGDVSDLWIWLVVAGAVILIGAGTAVYLLIIRKRKGKKE